MSENFASIQLEHRPITQRVELSDIHKKDIRAILTEASRAVVENPLMTPEKTIQDFHIPIEKPIPLTLQIDETEHYKRTIVLPKGTAVAKYTNQPGVGNSFLLTIRPESPGPVFTFSPFLTPSGDYMWSMQREKDGATLDTLGKTDFYIVFSNLTNNALGEQNGKYVLSQDDTSPNELNAQLAILAARSSVSEATERIYIKNHPYKVGSKEFTVRTFFAINDTLDKREETLLIAEPSLNVNNQLIGRSIMYTNTVRKSNPSISHQTVVTQLRNAGEDYRYLLEADDLDYISVAQRYAAAFAE